MDKYLSTKDLSQKQTSTDSDTDKLLAWHPHRNMLAIAQKDGVVYVYEKDASSVQWKQTVLKHQLMRNITCLEWKLRTSGTLAVGCRYKQINVCMFSSLAKQCLQRWCMRMDNWEQVKRQHFNELPLLSRSH